MDLAHAFWRRTLVPSSFLPKVRHSDGEGLQISDYSPGTAVNDSLRVQRGDCIADSSQLAKASTLALISMLVIIVTVITQGATVGPEAKGSLDGYLFINSGIFQAIGVISFGMLPFSKHCGLVLIVIRKLLCVVSRVSAPSRS